MGRERESQKNCMFPFNGAEFIVEHFWLRGLRLPNVWMYFMLLLLMLMLLKFIVSPLSRSLYLPFSLCSSPKLQTNQVNCRSILQPSQTGRVSQKQFPIICIYLNILQNVCPHASVFHFISFHSSINKNQFKYTHTHTRSLAH